MLSIARGANFDELLNAAVDATMSAGESMREFLDHAALVAGDVDSNDESARPVSLLTMHNAKGSGVRWWCLSPAWKRADYFLHSRSLDSEALMEEEWRHFVSVGMTRRRNASSTQRFCWPRSRRRFWRRIAGNSRFARRFLKASPGRAAPPCAGDSPAGRYVDL